MTDAEFDRIKEKNWEGYDKKYRIWLTCSRGAKIEPDVGLNEWMKKEGYTKNEDMKMAIARWETSWKKTGLLLSGALPSEC